MISVVRVEVAVLDCCEDCGERDADDEYEQAAIVCSVEVVRVQATDENDS